MFFGKRSHARENSLLMFIGVKIIKVFEKVYEWIIVYLTTTWEICTRKLSLRFVRGLVCAIDAEARCSSRDDSRSIILLFLCKHLWRVGKQHHAVEAIINWNWWYVWTEKLKTSKGEEKDEEMKANFHWFGSSPFSVFWSRQGEVFVTSIFWCAARCSNESIFMVGFTFHLYNSISLVEINFWSKINNKIALRASHFHF